MHPLSEFDFPIPVHHIGPPKEAGPLPTILYFAVSAQESLELDPFNQPVKIWQSDQLRIFSFSLPFHDHPHDKKEAFGHWKKALEKGLDPLETFLQQSLTTLELLISTGWIDPQQISVAGLSRGAFAACHLAARDPRLKTILGFAPLTDLALVQEFTLISNLPSIAKSRLTELIPQLCNRIIRFYIGTYDRRVGTRACVDFILKLAEYAESQGKRSPHVECILSPSAGYLGHGTLPHTFKEGAHWLKTHMIEHNRHTLK